MEKANQIQAYLKNKILATSPTAFVDGPADPEMFLNNDIRVLWVLQEPYCFDGLSHDQAQERAQATCLADLCSNRKTDGAETLERVVRLAHSIKQNALYTGDVFQSKEAYQSFKENTAIINLKKEPNTISTESNETELKAAWETWGEVVKEQIEAYRPTAVVYGGTFKIVSGGIGNYRIQLLKPHLTDTSDVSKQTFTLLNETIAVNQCYYMQNQHTVVVPGEKRLSISAYHPSRKPMRYVAEILFAIQCHLNRF